MEQTIINMKAIIFLIAIFFAVGCNAQKPIFHALNKSQRSAVNIYTTTTSSSSCSGSGATTNIYIASGIPVVGSVCYTSQYGATKFVGNGNWYYSTTWGTGYQINSSGVIIALSAC